MVNLGHEISKRNLKNENRNRDPNQWPLILLTFSCLRFGGESAILERNEIMNRISYKLFCKVISHHKHLIIDGFNDCTDKLFKAY